MAALTAGMNRPGATPADLGPGGPPAARTTGPVGGDRSAAVSSGTRTVRSWPLLVLAAPAAAEVWSGWAGIAQKTGFGLVSPLPGIWPSLHLDTSITLPVGVEAYAAYALRAWLAGGHPVSGRTRRFAKWSAICSFALGMSGQVPYHLLAQAGAARAPWPVTTIVSCLPAGPGPGHGHHPGPHAARRRRTRPRDEGTGRRPGPRPVLRGPGRALPRPHRERRDARRPRPPPARPRPGAGGGRGRAARAARPVLRGPGRAIPGPARERRDTRRNR